jgi:hypothetical protein
MRWMACGLVILLAGCAGGASDEDGGDAGVAPDSGPLDGADTGDGGGQGDDVPGSDRGVTGDGDRGGDTGVEPGACGFEEVPEGSLEIVQVVSEDEGTCVKLFRRDIGACMGMSSDYELLSLTVGHAGDTVEIADEESLRYVCSIHNWFDEAEGRHQGILYHLEMVVDWEHSHVLHYHLQASDEHSEEILWGPIELFEWSP